MNQDEVHVVQTALQFIAAFKYCAEPAVALNECEQHGGDCQKERDAMDRCAQIPLSDGRMQKDLLAIGTSECQHETRAVIECQQRGAGGCEAAEKKLLLCSSVAVVQALAEAARARENQ